MARSPSAAAVFPIDYGLYPKPEENPRTIRTFVTLEAATPYTLSLGTLVDQEALSNIQTIKIDNSAGANPVTVRAGKTGDTVICPAYSQGYYPFLFGDDSNVEISRADAGLITLWLINMPMPTAQWSVVASGGTIIIPDGGDVAFGATTDTPATTNTGTFTFMSLFKRLLSSLFPATPTQSSAAYTGASQTLLAANANRRGATIYNDHATTLLYVKLGAVASLTSFSYLIQPTQTLEVPYGYTGVIDAISSAAAGSARITEIAI